MKVVDANVLLYAVDGSATHHAASHAWLDDALAGVEAVGLPWASLVAFVRVSTHSSIQAHPLTADQATDIVDAWLGQPAAVVLQPDGRHFRRLRDLLPSTGAGGNLVNDTHLAALALQHRATVVTFDDDFDRFPGVRWERPGSS
ncbi:MAG: TA system VapC family ribonuclease toxin [Dermatophilaceae bacterium]